MALSEVEGENEGSKQTEECQALSKLLTEKKH